MKNLMVPIANKAQNITFVLYQVTADGDVTLASTDSEGVTTSEGDVLEILNITDGSSYQENDIIFADEQYLLRPFSQRSSSGAVYKAAGIYGPFYRNDTQDAYDWRAIFLQNNDVLADFYSTMKKDIQNEFTLIFLLLPLYCIALCTILGLIMYYCVLKPIQQLGKTAQGNL